MQIGALERRRGGEDRPEAIAAQSVGVSRSNGHPPPWMDEPAPERRLTLVPASSIAVRPVRWLWHDRIALGTLCLLAGREGIGKSLLAYTLAADITQGRMVGEFFEQPKGVIVAATEDSWAHTIVPRLMAAGADLQMVYRVDVTKGDLDVGLELPVDVGELKAAIRESDAALVLLDPLMSRLHSDLDSHKDAEVRQALEPLVALGDQTGASLLGLIHLNKSASTDMLTLMMGSRAFAAVARSVLFAMEDPNDKKRRLLGQAKNNLGRSDLPTRTFSVESKMVAQTSEGEVWTGALVWGADSDVSLKDALSTSRELDTSGGETTATQEAAEWLEDYLTQEHGQCESSVIKRAARQAGHADRTLARARAKLKIKTGTIGFPRRTTWTLTSYQPEQDD